MTYQGLNKASTAPRRFYASQFQTFIPQNSSHTLLSAPKSTFTSPNRALKSWAASTSDSGSQSNLSSRSPSPSLPLLRRIEPADIMAAEILSSIATSHSGTVSPPSDPKLTLLEGPISSDVSLGRPSAAVLAAAQQAQDNRPQRGNSRREKVERLLGEHPITFNRLGNPNLDANSLRLVTEAPVGNVEVMTTVRNAEPLSINLAIAPSKPTISHTPLNPHTALHSNPSMKRKPKTTFAPTEMDTRPVTERLFVRDDVVSTPYPGDEESSDSFRSGVGSVRQTRAISLDPLSPRIGKRNAQSTAKQQLYLMLQTHSYPLIIPISLPADTSVTNNPTSTTRSLKPTPATRLPYRDDEHLMRHVLHTYTSFNGSWKSRLSARTVARIRLQPFTSIGDLEEEFENGDRGAAMAALGLEAGLGDSSSKEVMRALRNQEIEQYSLDIFHEPAMERGGHRLLNLLNTALSSPTDFAASPISPRTQIHSECVNRKKIALHLTRAWNLRRIIFFLSTVLAVSVLAILLFIFVGKEEWDFLRQGKVWGVVREGTRQRVLGGFVLGAWVLIAGGGFGIVWGLWSLGRCI